MTERRQTIGPRSTGRETLHDSLVSFAKAVNGNGHVKRIVKDWSPTIVVQATDTGNQFHFTVRDAIVGDPVAGEGFADHRVVLNATEDVLCEVFTGAVNPVRANLDGKLAVFANDRDNVKLDAICMVLWGV